MPGRTPIPHYYLYGRLEDDAEAEVELDFLHIEPIRKRSGAAQLDDRAARASAPHAGALRRARAAACSTSRVGRFEVAAPCLMAVPVGAVHQIRFQPDTDGWVITAAESFVAQAAHGDARLVEAAAPRRRLPARRHRPRSAHVDGGVREPPARVRLRRPGPPAGDHGAFHHASSWR